MKALVVASPGSVSLVHYDEPTAAVGEVIVVSQMVWMCGTDLELLLHPAVVGASGAPGERR
jgi:threonine dehydrogenase-like Zn-dependent dehydrogenase